MSFVVAMNHIAPRALSETVVMRRPYSLRFFILFTLLCLFASCKTTNLPPISPANSFQIEEDEQEVWQHGEQLERILDKTGLLYKDPQLESYLDHIGKALLGQEDKNQVYAVRIRVIKHPFLNAFALPHGVVYLYTGLLARMENEAQLATILGHELTHFTHRHTVKEIRSAQNKETLMFVLQTMVSIAGTGLGGGQVGSALGELAGDAGAVWTLASVRGYSRELETEADVTGLRLMIDAGYDPNEGIRMFELLRHELEEYKIKEPFPYGTHPHIQSRIDNYRTILSSDDFKGRGNTERLKNTEAFQAKIEPVILENIDLDLQANRLAVAWSGIRRILERRPDCGRAYFFLGEFYRLSGRDDANRQQATVAYHQSVRLSPKDPLPYRELGFLYRTMNRRQEARDAFNQYLILSPTAVDSRIIRRYLTELNDPPSAP